MITPTESRGLLRVLGSAFGLAIVVGATIGGGILGTPSTVAAALPVTSLFLLAWGFGGVNAMLGATAYAELGAMMPSAGGAYVYAQRALGDTVGFFTGYADWVNWCVSAAAVVLLIGVYVGNLVPALAAHALVTGAATCGVLVAIQLVGVRWGARTQELSSALKAIALLALVAAALLLPHPHVTAAAAPAVVPHGFALILTFAIAMQGVIFSYDGYYAVVYCGEEVQQPGRVIPRSIFRGLALVMGIYLLLNVAFLRVIPVTAMAHDPFVGGTVARALFGDRGDTVVRIIMVVALISTANALIIAAPRVLLAMARNGLFPAQATRINRGGTPTVALMLSVLLIGGFLAIGTFDAVIAIDAFIIVAIYVVVFVSLFVLRRTAPLADRPYRATGYPFVPGLALILAVLLLIVMALGDHRSALITAAVFAASWPASHLARRLIHRDIRRAGTVS